MPNPLTEHLTDNHINNNSTDGEYFLDISEVWLAVSHFWRLILSLVFLFAVIATLLTFIIPKQWEASTTLHIGRLQSDSGEPKLVEDPLQTVERTKQLGFKENLLTDLHLPKESGVDKRTDLLLGSLKGSAIKNTDFVSLSARGYSPSDAVNTLQATVKEIKTAHSAITQPTKALLMKEAQLTTDSLTTALLELTNLKNQISMVGVYKTNAAFAPSIVATNLLASKEADVRSLQTQKIQYNSRLAAIDEQATAIVNTIDVSTRPIYPKKIIFLIAGALLGFFVGTGIAILKFKKGNTTR